MTTWTLLRRARMAAAATIFAAGVFAAAAPALADPPAGDPPGRSGEAPGLQEAPPGQAAAEVPPGPPPHAEAAPAAEPAGPPADVPPGPPDHAAAQGPPAEVPPADPGGGGGGDGAGNGEVPPGNAGTVKIHEVGTPDDDRRNEPKVCDFRIVGFGFPADAALVVSIVGHGGPNAGAGSFGPTAPIGVDADGGFAIDGPTLPDGMYKLFVENTTAPGGAKQKVFKVECDDVGGGNEEEPPITPTEEEPEVLPTSEERTVTPAAGAATAALPTEVAGIQATRGSLAFSGADVFGLVVLGAALVGGGAALRRRHA